MSGSPRVSMNGCDDQNAPKLKAEDAPWDVRHRPGFRELIRSMPKAWAYLRKHGMFAVPEAVDVWQYRDLLRRLDLICMRGLRTYGAMSASELAAWINHRKLLRTEPSKTGIARVSRATVADWIELAWRREVVAPWPAGTGGGSPAAVRWTAVEGSGPARSSMLLSLLPRLLEGVVGLLASGTLAAVVGWLATARLAPTVVLTLAGLALYVVFAMGMGRYIGKRLSPNEAVVMIETLRCGKRGLPSLADATEPPARGGRPAER